MATLMRTDSKANPTYKDYVNFLGAYKGAKRDAAADNSDSAFSSNSSLSKSSSNSSSSINSVNSDVPDFTRSSCTPYNTYLGNSKTKKFNPVRPNLGENATQKIEIVKFEEQKTQTQQTSITKPEEKKMQKTEITIEIQSTKSVTEVSKMFEKQKPPKTVKVSSRGDNISTKIGVFEKNSENKPKSCKSGWTGSRAPPPQIVMVSQTAEEEIQANRLQPPAPSPPPPKDETDSSPPPPPPPLKLETNENNLPPPPQQNIQRAIVTGGPQKNPVTPVSDRQTKYTVNTANAMKPYEIDRNDPAVKKLVYGTLRGLYGSYHDKANHIVSTLPKHMVVKNNGLQDIIDKIAANGDLDKLTGRVNPKVEE